MLLHGIIGEGGGGVCVISLYILVYVLTFTIRKIAIVTAIVSVFIKLVKRLSPWDSFIF